MKLLCSSLFVILPFMLPLATSRSSSSTDNSTSSTMDPSVEDSDSSSERLSASSHSSVTTSESSSSEEIQDLLSQTKNRIRDLRSDLKKKKKEVKRLTGDKNMKFSKIPDHIKSMEEELAKRLKKLGIYKRLRMADILAMSPKAFKKDVTKRYESSANASNIKLYKEKIEKYTDDKESLKSQIEDERERYKSSKKVTKKSTKRLKEDLQKHEELVGGFKETLEKVRKKIASYKKKLNDCRDMRDEYKLLLKMPLCNVLGKNSISALYEACADIEKALEREKRRYARLTGKEKTESSISEEEKASSTSQETQGSISGEEQASSTSKETGASSASEEEEPAGRSVGDCIVCMDAVNEEQAIRCMDNGHICCAKCFCGWYDPKFLSHLRPIQISCPACRGDFSDEQIDKSQTARVALIRELRDDKTLQNKYMANGKAVKSRSPDAKNLLKAAHRRIKRYLLILKGSPNYDRFFNDLANYPHFYIPENLHEYLLKDHNPRTIGYQSHKAAFIDRAKKSLTNQVLDDNTRWTTLRHLFESFFMEDFILEYLCTSRLFGMNNDPVAQRQEISNNRDVYPAISKMLRIGEFYEDHGLDALSRAYTTIRDKLGDENDDPNAQLLTNFDRDNEWMMTQV